MAATASATALVSRGSPSCTGGSSVMRAGRGAEGPAAGGGASLPQAAMHRRTPPAEAKRRSQDMPDTESGVVEAVMEPEDSQTRPLGNRQAVAKEIQPTMVCGVYD